LITTLGGNIVVGCFRPRSPLKHEFATHTIGLAGATRDPLAALVFCAPERLALSVIHDCIVVRDDRLTTPGLRPLLERQSTVSRALLPDQ